MDNATANLLDETVKLIQRYNADLTFQKQLDRILDNPQISLRQVLYHGRPLKLYTDIISQNLAEYKKYREEIKSSPPAAKDLLHQCYNQRDLRYLDSLKTKVIQVFNQGEQQEIDQIEQLPPEKKAKEYKKILTGNGSLPPPKEKNSTVGEIEQQQQEEDAAAAMLLGEGNMPTIPRLQLKKIGGTEDGEEDFEVEEREKAAPEETPQQATKTTGTIRKSISSRFSEIGKNFLSRASIFIRTATTRFPTLTSSFISGTIGAALGYSVGHSAEGAVIGAVGGGIAPWITNTSGGQQLASDAVSAGSRAASKFGNAVLDTGNNLLKNQTEDMLKKNAMRLLLTTPVGWGIIAIIIFIFLFVFIIIVQQGGSPGGTTVATNLSSCSFIREGQSPSGAQFQSPLLLSYFQEASQLSGVPAVVLAAIARVESPSSVNLTDTDFSSFCPVSSTGALGLMQIQPPGTRGYSADSVALGAQFLGTTVDQLTQEDFCNPQKNIILAAGFIIKKMGYLYGGDGKSWNPAWNDDKNAIDTLATGYYGCLNYGGSDPLKCEGPYSYGNDIWESIQSCQISNTAMNLSATASCPVPGGKITFSSYHPGPPPYGHCSPSYGYTCDCGTGGRRAKSIDINTGGPNGSDVVLPTIGNQGVNWKFLQIFPVSDGEGGGSGYVFVATDGSNTWDLQLLHMGPTGLSADGTTIYPSGTVVGKTVIDHVHTTIGENIKNPLNSGSTTTDCDLGWLASDFMCSAQ